MRTHQIGILAGTTLLSLALSGCGKSTDNQSPSDKPKAAAEQSGKEGETGSPAAKPAEVKLATLDLAKAGLPLTLQAPEGATAENNAVGGVVVEKGDKFEIHINDIEKSTFGRRKKDAKKIHVETSDTILFEEEPFGRTLFKFDLIVKVGDQQFYIREGGRIYSKEDCELMLKCAKTLAPK